MTDLTIQKLFSGSYDIERRIIWNLKRPVKYEPEKFRKILEEKIPTLLESWNNDIIKDWNNVTIHVKEEEGEFRGKGAIGKDIAMKDFKDNHWEIVEESKVWREQNKYLFPLLKINKRWRETTKKYIYTKGYLKSVDTIKRWLTEDIVNIRTMGEVIWYNGEIIEEEGLKLQRYKNIKEYEIILSYLREYNYPPIVKKLLKPEVYFSYHLTGLMGLQCTFCNQTLVPECYHLMKGGYNTIDQIYEMYTSHYVIERKDILQMNEGERLMFDTCIKMLEKDDVSDFWIKCSNTNRNFTIHVPREHKKKTIEDEFNAECEMNSYWYVTNNINLEETSKIYYGEIEYLPL